PLIIHEQNAIAGTANRWLAKLARKALTGFPGALHGAVMVGNPVRPAFASLAPSAERYASREGRLHLLVVGGSLGASILNTVVPEALGRMASAERPMVTHQAGAQHIDELKARYERVGIDAKCVAFIDD